MPQDRIYLCLHLTYLTPLPTLPLMNNLTDLTYFTLTPFFINYLKILCAYVYTFTFNTYKF